MRLHDEEPVRHRLADGPDEALWADSSADPVVACRQTMAPPQTDDVVLPRHLGVGVLRRDEVVFSDRTFVQFAFQ